MHSFLYAMFNILAFDCFDFLFFRLMMQCNGFLSACHQLEHGFCWTVEFQCAQGYKCIPKFNQCDGFTDCPDHSDEANCDLISPCGDMFQCRGGSCIEQELVCNGYADCMGNEDEPSSCGLSLFQCTLLT